MSPQRLADLEPSLRRRAVLRSVLTIAVAWVVMFTVYYLVPFGKESNVGALIRLSVGLVVVGVVLYRHTQRILNVELPELRAAEALAVVFPLFLLVFSVLYLSFSHAYESSFTQRLDHTRALYFAITVFSTVGFGDITPRTDSTRIIVSIQMLLDLVFIGLVVRLLFNAAKSGLGRREPEPSGSEGLPAGSDPGA